MKLCKDCKYFNDSTAQGDCLHDVNLKVNYLTGGIITRMYPQDLREIETLCGPEARYFNEKERVADFPVGPMGGMSYGRATGMGV